MKENRTVQSQYLIHIAFNREYEFCYVSYKYTYKVCKKMLVVSNYKYYESETLCVTNKFKIDK